CMKRHQRAAAAAFSVLTIPIRACLDRLGNPQFMAELQSMSAVSLLREAIKAVAGLPEIAAMERASLNIGEDGVLPERPDPLKDKPMSADAADLAIRLLIEIQEPGSGASAFGNADIDVK